MKVHTKIIKAFGALLVVVLLLCMVPVSKVEAAFDEYWVSTDGLCGGNSPCTDNLQSAIKVVADGGTVHVGAGEYTVPGDTHVFLLADGKRLLGSGADVTTLKGDGTREVISVSGDSMLDGFTITGGVGHTGNGGGMNINSGSPTISNCIFTGNYASNSGGAIYVSDASPLIEYCTFEDNEAGNSGGAVYVNKDSPLIENCTFKDNEATNGGALYFSPLHNAGPLRFNAFLGNTATRGTAVNYQMKIASDVDARYNWWGSEDGPTVGMRNQIYRDDYVLFDPFCTDSSCDFPVENVTQGTYFYTIQGAIDAASDGDTIEVGPGTYNENLTIDVPNLTIQSTDGADVTILDVPYDGSLTTAVKVLANMGIVTFDGFTLQNFTEGGIIQGMSAREGTTFRVLNNKLYPYADYLRNGIQVTGDGSFVDGNYVQGAYLTEEWASTAIGVVNANNVIVQNNTVQGPADVGIDAYVWGEYTVGNIQILNNTIMDVDVPLGVESYNNGTVDGVELHLNKVTNYTVPLISEPYPDAPYTGLAVLNVDAIHNWWGSMYGPTSGQISGDVEFAPWCGDADCTFTLPDANGEIELPVGVTHEEIQTAINNAPTGTTIIIPAGTYNKTGGFEVTNSGLTIILSDGTIIQNNSPCFTVSADDTTISGPPAGTTTCIPTDGSSGVEVNGGLTNIVIENFEIDGADGTHGILFEGAAVTDVIVRDMYIHDMKDGDGLRFDNQPAGTVQIKGNLFMDNFGVGVEAPADLDVTYNAWGHAAGPNAGDGVSTNITSYSPWCCDDACSFFGVEETVMDSVDDVYYTVVDGSLTVTLPGVLENDTLGGTADFTARKVTDVGEGTLDWPTAEDGSFTFTPPGDWVGTTTFTYRSCDADDVCAVEPATVTIETRVGAEDDSYNTLVDEKLIISAANGVLDNDFGLSGETLTATILTYVDEGVLTFMPNGGFSYDPPTGWTGTTSFTYKACGDDLNYCSLPAEVTISVTEEEPEEPPTAVEDAYSTAFNKELIVPAPGVLENDTAPEGKMIVAELVTNVPLGKGELRLDDDGGFAYTPPMDWSGSTSFTYRACLADDLTVCSEPVTVTIEVGPRFTFFYYLPLITD